MTGRKTLKSFPWINDAVFIPVEECNVFLQNVMLKADGFISILAFKIVQIIHIF